MNMLDREPIVTDDFDRLTRLGTREPLMMSLRREVESARLAEQPLAVGVLDIDKFSSVNDRLGHPGGDEVLRSLAHRLRRLDRGTAVAYRVGGDEFALVLPQANLMQAGQFCERLTSRMAAFTTDGTRYLTVSYGVAELIDDDDAEALLRRANQDLQRRKSRPPEESGV